MDARIKCMHSQATSQVTACGLSAPKCGLLKVETWASEPWGAAQPDLSSRDTSACVTNTVRPAMQQVHTGES